MLAEGEDLAKLIDIAGEGIPAWLWSRSASNDKSVLGVGIERARRESGGFSYRNARIACATEATRGMVLSYPIDTAPEDNPDDLPAAIAPFVTLEQLSVGTWYISALTVFPRYGSNGIGTTWLRAAEKQAQAAGYAQMSIQVYAQNSGAARLTPDLGALKA